MKKYNLSKIMKRAWELVKKAGANISGALKKAWEEAKEVKEEIVKLNVVGSETFTVNTATGEISGKTYNSKDWIKRNFDAKWNPEKKAWFADPETVKAELENTRYYEKYIVSIEKNETSENDEIIKKELVNRNDGFYSKNTHRSGKVTYSFVG